MSFVSARVSTMLGKGNNLDSFNSVPILGSFFILKFDLVRHLKLRRIFGILTLYQNCITLKIIAHKKWLK